MALNSPVAPEEHDWTYEVTDRIESVVTTVREKTTVPAIIGARGVVYGIVAVVLAVVLLAMFIILALRLLYVYLPIHPLARRVWIADAIVSAIFLGAGAFAWWKGRVKDA
jgi:hypothetical protein